MWNFIKILLISLLVLSGCSQPPSNESSRNAGSSLDAKKGVLTKQVRLFLGGGNGDSNKRVLGSYQDVDAVNLDITQYVTDNGIETDIISKTVSMVKEGESWTADIVLTSYGDYQFGARALSSEGVLIFQSAAPQMFTISEDTPSELFLNLMMNPILDDSINFELQRITELIVPQTYIAGDNLTVGFEVTAAPSDDLIFRLKAEGISGGFYSFNDNASFYNYSDVDGVRTYQDLMSIFIDSIESDNLTVTFTAESTKSGYTAHAKFQVNLAQTAQAPYLIFVPTIKQVNITSSKNEPELQYEIILEGYNPSTYPFVTTDPYISGENVNPDNEMPHETTSPDDDIASLTGSFSRTDVDQSSTLNLLLYIDILDDHGSQISHNFTYSFVIPAGATQFTAVAGGEDFSIPGSGGSGSGSSGPYSPTIRITGINDSEVDLQYDNYFEFAPQGTHDLITDGTARFYLNAWDNSSDGGSYYIEIRYGMDTVVWDSTSDGGEFYLAAGTYTIAFAPDGIGDGLAEIRPYPVHALEDEAGTMVDANDGIDGGITSLASGATDTRHIFFNDRAGKLVIVQDNESPRLSLSLFDADDNPVNDNNGPITSETGELFVGSTNDFYLPSGDYQLQITNNTSADWNGRLVAYSTNGTETKVTTPDGMHYYSDNSVNLNVDNYTQSAAASFIVDVAQQCLAGQSVRVYGGGDPQALDGNVIGVEDESSSEIIVSSTECEFPFQIVVPSGISYLMFDVYFAPIEITAGLMTWSYDNPQAWKNVYEPSIYCPSCFSQFEIMWQQPVDNETMTVAVANQDSDIELGIMNEVTWEMEWGDAGASLGPIDLSRADTSLWVGVRYVGSDIEGPPLSKFLNIIFQNNNTMDASSNYGNVFNIQFEVIDND